MVEDEASDNWARFYEVVQQALKDVVMMWRVQREKSTKRSSFTIRWDFGRSDHQKKKEIQITIKHGSNGKCQLLGQQLVKGLIVVKDDNDEKVIYKA